VSLDNFDKAPFAFNGRISQVKVKYLSGEARSRALQ
jgi:ribosomal protein S28E/S33